MMNLSLLSTSVFALAATTQAHPQSTASTSCSDYQSQWQELVESAVSLVEYAEGMECPWPPEEDNDIDKTGNGLRSRALKEDLCNNAVEELDDLYSEAEYLKMQMAQGGCGDDDTKHISCNEPHPFLPGEKRWKQYDCCWIDQDCQERNDKGQEMCCIWWVFSDDYCGVPSGWGTRCNNQSSCKPVRGGGNPRWEGECCMKHSDCADWLECRGYECTCPPNRLC